MLDVKHPYGKKVIPPSQPRPTNTMPPHPVKPTAPTPAQAARPTVPKPKKSKKKKILLVIIAILIVAALAAIIIFQQIKLNADLTDEQSARRIQDKAAKIMILPEEDALVSDISNVDQVSEQPFFSKAQNGDKVLIFVQAAKIVIYRESANQIVNAGPLIDDRTAE